MFRLFYSNRTEELLAEIAIRVRAQQLRDGPLVPVSIVVPSAAVESYVRVGVARQCGVAANLDVSLLTRFASDVIGATSGARVADAASLEAMGLALLFDEAWLADPAVAPLRAYLHSAGEGADAVDLRRVQLASRLGRIFEEYTYSRGELLAAWRSGTALGAEHGETERWQRAVWLAMFGEGGLASRPSPPGAPARGPIVPLYEAVRALEPRAQSLPSAVHVFAFAHVGRAFHDLFVRLAGAIDVVVYALSPCEGFWEDVDDGDPAPLRLWARPGREQVRALNASAGFDHEDRFVDPLSGDAPSLLRRIQHDVLTRSSSHDSRPADGSLSILEHASIRREVEALASAVWRVCEEDDTLRFDDIAILVPESEAAEYAAQIDTVFREAHGIPHQSVGLAAAAPTRIAEAVGLLLALPLGRFTRQDLLRIAVHPSVVASLGNIDASSWVAWCDALGIVHGADREDHQGTYIQRDILNWDQGLRRLALGALMAGDASGDRRPVDVGGHAYVPHELPPSELRDAAAFGRLVRSLVADARFAASAELTLREWSRFLAAMVDAYVTPEGSDEEEEIASCLRRIHATGMPEVGEVRVRYRVAHEIASERLARAPRGRGGEGVIVSTLPAVRPLPFRVVFACGLGEGKFPANDAEDPLDLRWAERQSGDVSARERDRYSFLELLLGTRDRLVLSYVSRDAVTGDPLAPSSVVQELVHAVEGQYSLPVSAWRVRHPLRRWDASYFPELRGAAAGSAPLGTMSIPEARAEAITAALRERAEAAGVRPSLDEVRTRAATDPAWRALAHHLLLPPLPDLGRAPDARLAIPLYALVKFLEFPLQGWARFRLGLDELDDDDEVMIREDEPFETSPRDKTTLLRRVILDAAARGVPLDAAYDREIEERELRGEGPSGVFARGERANHLGTLKTWQEILGDYGVPIGTLGVHRFGRAGEHARADVVHPGVALDVDVVDAGGVFRPLRVELTGRTMPMGEGASSSIALLARATKETNDWARAERERIALRAFVDHAVLSASGAASDRVHDAIVIIATGEGGTQHERVRFAGLSRDEATGWLRAVVRDLLTGSHAYFLPCEAVFARRRDDPGGALTPWIEKARSRLGDSEDRAALRSAYGPVPRVGHYPAPDEAEGQALADRRFELLFTKREETP